MENQFTRTAALLGEEAIKRLSQCRVAVFGIGGVGSYAVEALARGGIGSFLLVDSDRVSVTNINRQLIATHNTVGLPKAQVARERILSINPEAQVETSSCFFSPENSGKFDFSRFDYVVDAIDSVSGKIELVLCCERAGTPIISCMGTGNKLDPTAFCVTDIYKTDTCPLARVMRRELRARGIKSLPVVYSKEPAITPLLPTAENLTGRAMPPASVPFVPSVAGLIAASEVIKRLSGAQ